MTEQIYRLLADLLMLLHFGFVLFALLGGLFLFWKPFLIWLHLPAFLWAGMIAISGGICPLTPLEVWLRYQGGQSGYELGFVEHYIMPLLYPSGLTRDTQILMGIFVLFLNLIVYAVFVKKSIKSKD